MFMLMFVCFAQNINSNWIGNRCTRTKFLNPLMFIMQSAIMSTYSLTGHFKMKTFTPAHKKPQQTKKTKNKRTNKKWSFSNLHLLSFGESVPSLRFVFLEWNLMWFYAVIVRPPQCSLCVFFVAFLITVVVKSGYFELLWISCVLEPVWAFSYDLFYQWGVSAYWTTAHWMFFCFSYHSA